MTTSSGASLGRVLRANRCCQDSRQCARSVRVKTVSEGRVTDEGDGGASGSVTSMVSLRTTFSHLRRMAHRGQSFQRTGVQGGAGGASVCAEGQSGDEESSGHNTALTRRGLIVVLLS